MTGTVPSGPPTAAAAGFNRLLCTKLLPPRPWPGCMERPELTSVLSARAGPGRLTFVEAPAGWGKSTALAAWLRTVPGPAAWYSVDESDNDAVRFWSYVLAGLAGANEEGTGVGCRSGRLLAAPGTSVLDDVVPVLVNELCARTAAVTLVLNDYHRIRDPQIHATLGRLIEHLPPSLSLVVSSRFGPPSTWPINRLRAENILVEVGAEDLRFTRAQAAQLLTKEVCTPLSDADIDVLYDRTEGWPAGLHLAALSLQGCTDLHGLITAFSGTVRHITDYLMEEVLDRQPPPMRTFLRRTSILDRMCASLCDRVTDGDDASGQLHRAEQELQFLTVLDNEGSWFRYHHLIADVLQRELQHTEPELIPVLHRRAAAWHQEHGLAVDAVRHALAAEDVATACDFITTDYVQVANDGQLATVLGWFDAIGEPAVCSDTDLLAARAMTALIANDLSVAKSWIDLAVHADADAGGRSRADLGAKEALVQQFYSYACGDMGRALGWSREALRLIPQDQVWHDLSRSNAAFVDTRLNHFDEAVEGHLRTLAQADATNHHLLAVRAIGGLCKLFVLRGERDAAREWLDRADTDVRFRILDEHYQTHRRHLVHGWLELADGRPEVAEPPLTRAYQLVRRGSARLEHVEVLTTLARAREQLARDGDAAGLRAAADQILSTCPDPGHLLGPPAEDETAATHPRVPGPHPLTQRESTVLAVLATGATNAEIARRLYLSERTVEAHLRSIYHKIGVRSRSAATRYALDNNLT
ncbi:LuxR C-terminal-related transcriptional regulator [Dactylosporangium sp. NPDC049525]|uniref:LuxR C-terminal-related transcriptional regulator n=1 Tax=Dactylosporangium sp. NPDC049525 TaxID=3154730 RepID=UPI003430C21B